MLLFACTQQNQVCACADGCLKIIFLPLLPWFFRQRLHGVVAKHDGLPENLFAQLKMVVMICGGVGGVFFKIHVFPFKKWFQAAFFGIVTAFTN